MLLVIGRRLSGGRGGCTAMIDATRKRALQRLGRQSDDSCHRPAWYRNLARRHRRAVPHRRHRRRASRISGLRAVTDPTGGRLVLRNRPSETLRVFRESDSTTSSASSRPTPDGTDGSCESTSGQSAGVTLQSSAVTTHGPASQPALVWKDLPPLLVNSIASLWPRPRRVTQRGTGRRAERGRRGGRVGQGAAGFSTARQTGSALDPRARHV
jgi:hypothetical protein